MMPVERGTVERRRRVEPDQVATSELYESPQTVRQARSSSQGAPLQTPIARLAARLEWFCRLVAVPS